MAKKEKVLNGQNGRAVKVLTQVYNPVTGNFILRDSSTGKFAEVKSDGKPFRGVTKERRITKVGIVISPSIARKAEQSVIKMINRKSK